MFSMPPKSKKQRLLETKAKVARQGKKKEISEAEFEIQSDISPIASTSVPMEMNDEESDSSYNPDADASEDVDGLLENFVED